MSLDFNNEALPYELRPFAVKQTSKTFQSIKACGVHIQDSTSYLDHGQIHRIEISSSLGFLELTAAEATQLGKALVAVASAQAARLHQGGAA